ncbi:MAG: hypothetical protein L6Q78_16030 [Bacteroidia bacterium]|nr:hypothetical protein [Bacteroidia bacterium]
MSLKNKVLEVDVIGGLRPLTKEEELRISEYLKSRKLKQISGAPKKRQVRPKAIAAK